MHSCMAWQWHIVSLMYKHNSCSHTYSQSYSESLVGLNWGLPNFIHHNFMIIWTNIVSNICCVHYFKLPAQLIAASKWPSCEPDSFHTVLNIVIIRWQPWIIISNRYISTLQKVWLYGTTAKTENLYPVIELKCNLSVACLPLRSAQLQNVVKKSTPL